ncbi:MAG: MarR family transcriptional regulator [Gammaproteobacteria bacterium]|nr:MarR family transcriptional regulator [Gammaproteobacteria bacterium]
MNLHEIFTHTIASRGMRKVFVKSLLVYELIYGEFEILYLLSGSEALKPSEITYALNCQPAATSRIVKSLLQRNFVEYDQNQDDHRAVTVSLNEQGKMLIETIKDAFKKLTKKEIN